MQIIPVDLHRTDSDYPQYLCENLERGNILLLSSTPYHPVPEDADFLRSQRQTETASHKNIAYKPNRKVMTGANENSSQEAVRLKAILAEYSRGALETLGRLFTPYAASWRVDYASFRPVEEENRNLPLRHRNDLLHLDAFPTRPTHGGRILRAFTNLHPERDRVWATSVPFEELASRYAVAAGLTQVTGTLANLRRGSVRLARTAGITLPDRSPYDEFMLRFHHHLKSDGEFQRTGRLDTSAFPPGSTWISFTDQVVHAVVSGQYALEQTCIVPLAALLLPELAPVSVLERIADRALVGVR